MCLLSTNYKLYLLCCVYSNAYPFIFGFSNLYPFFLFQSIFIYYGNSFSYFCIGIYDVSSTNVTEEPVEVNGYAPEKGILEGQI